MKTCPICQAVAFDDARTCFGCLHEFAEGEGVAVPSVVIDADDRVPPAFLIKIRPERERSGLVTWSCTVDLVKSG